MSTRTFSTGYTVPRTGVAAVPKPKLSKEARAKIILTAFAMAVMLPIIMFFFIMDEMADHKAQVAYRNQIAQLEAQSSATEEKYKAEIADLEAALDDSDAQSKALADFVVTGNESKQKLMWAVDKASTEYAYVDMPVSHKAQVLLESQKYDNVDPQIIFALIAQESRFDPKAVSPTGARGYGQFIYKTGKWVWEDMLKNGKYSRDMAFNPYVNIEMTVKYFSYLMDLKKGNEEVALAYYNGLDDKKYVQRVKSFLPESNKKKEYRGDERKYF